MDANWRLARALIIHSKAVVYLQGVIMGVKSLQEEFENCIICKY